VGGRQRELDEKKKRDFQYRRIIPPSVQYSPPQTAQRMEIIPAPKDHISRPNQFQGSAPSTAREAPASSAPGDLYRCRL